MRYNTSERSEEERAKYKIKCSCGHTLIFTPSNKKNKILCNCCGYYVYRNEKEKFKELMKGKLRHE
jgi:hypothetical protein